MKTILRLTNLVKKIISLPNRSLSKKKIKKLIAKKNPVIFEIGCANGDDTLDFINTFAGTNLMLYGFEPEPYNIKIIKDRVSQDNFELFEGAISEVDGNITFNRSRTDNPEDLRLSGSIMSPKNHLKIWDWIHFDEKVTVKSISLDSFVKSKNIDTIDFIWMDVQGAEERVIRGGLKIFTSKVRFLFTEYSDDEQYDGQPSLQKILDMLPSFELVHNYGPDVLLRNKNL